MSKVKKSVTVGAPVDIVYRAWHNFDNFPAFMENIEEVRLAPNGRSHWKAKGPLGTAPEWDAEVTLDEPNQAIGWRSIEGDKSLRTAGRVNFREQGAASTAIDVTIEYDPPAGVLGDAVAKIFSNPDHQVEEDLQRFKETIEKGVELSGLNFGESPAPGGLGGSMGGNSAESLARISESNSGESPQGVDDPAMRRQT